MKYKNNFSEVINYIENNLTKELDCNEIEALVGSYLNFKKAFLFLTGISLNEYIRNRKLTRASFDLQNTNEKIIDISLKYGYDSPTAFNRAFRNMFGISPKEVRKTNQKLISFPPIVFDISLKGIQELKYSIVKKEAFHIIGRKKTMQISDNKYHDEITDFWTQCTLDIPVLITINDNTPKGIIATTKGDWENNGELYYWIGVSSLLENQFFEYEKGVIPKSLWAVFEFTGPVPGTIREGYKQIFTEWLPHSGYQLLDLPLLELYTEGDIKGDNYQTQIWLPIK